ncbi:hypothetical protein J5N97_013221 [Dioscorea zingiberensis]|uniref:Uncharacterized protein n=1 Tax=Dioscorea zingiberensis TaxID=325984 RepID=A0A9D5HIU9_9LILI|nr:hypothetical protein J5N97_013221 [Dioscorea zingiberensis]
MIPSASSFRHDLLPILTPPPLLPLQNQIQTKSPFLINAYPYFAFKADPKRFSLNYAILFEPNDGVVDLGSGIHYNNMLHAQVDVVRSAISKAGGDEGLEIRVSETEWLSAGDPDEAGNYGGEREEVQWEPDENDGQGTMSVIALIKPMNTLITLIFCWSFIGIYLIILLQTLFQLNKFSDLVSGFLCFSIFI